MKVLISNSFENGEFALSQQQKIKIFHIVFNYLLCVTFPKRIKICRDQVKGERTTVNSRYLEVFGTIFYTFKLPEVQIYLHFG